MGVVDLGNSGFCIEMYGWSESPQLTISDLIMDLYQYMYVTGTVHSSSGCDSTY